MAILSIIIDLAGLIIDLVRLIGELSAKNKK